MEIREHVVSSAWISGCAVSQTYGRNYQRKMEITSGLGLIRSPEQSRCVRTVLVQAQPVWEPHAWGHLPRVGSTGSWPALVCFLPPRSSDLPAAACPLLPEDPAADG